ncbi:MAG TPA: hypothetical protein VLA09_03340 [Longimicrobiales bacterium]|nr:hypothetical protein [Longimicrobiales bacterium]
MSDHATGRVSVSASGRDRIERRPGGGGEAAVRLPGDPKRERKAAPRVSKPELAP